jgi:formylglycine-generating enzyme required for sulfatase activity
MPAFQIGRRSVTNAEYRLFDPTWGLSFRTGDGYLKNSPTAEHPAVGLSFYDCWVYTRWLSGTHETIRMLFEEEWEYCAKMGLTASQWWWDFWFAAEASPENMPMGGRPEPSQKCLRRSIDCSASPASQQLDPLRQGIRGLQLNHWTWCEDIYRPLYSGRASTDSLPGPADSLRVLRGGSWRNEIAASVSWHRAANDAAEQGRNYGLRLARSWKR